MSDRKIVDFQTIHIDMLFLDEHVKEEIKKGWQPFGSPSFDSDLNVLQAMVKYEEVDSKHYNDSPLRKECCKCGHEIGSYQSHECNADKLYIRIGDDKVFYLKYFEKDASQNKCRICGKWGLHFCKSSDKSW